MTALFSNRLMKPMSKISDYLAKFAFLFLGMVAIKRRFTLIAAGLLILAWLLDGGLYRIKDVIKELLAEPFIRAVILLFLLVAIGLFWSENHYDGFRFLRRYLVFLIFIPYIVMLNRERLPWAIAGVLIGYFFVVSSRRVSRSCS